MKEQATNISQSNLRAGLQDIRLRASEEIKNNGFSQAAAILLAVTELIKEQTQNENASHTTR